MIFDDLCVTTQIVNAYFSFSTANAADKAFRTIYEKVLKTQFENQRFAATILIVVLYFQLRLFSRRETIQQYNGCRIHVCRSVHQIVQL